MDESEKTSRASTTPAAKQAWERPTLKYVGDVGDVFLGGSGKTSVNPQDPGEANKPTGGGDG